jgi:hypothetical protein
LRWGAGELRWGAGESRRKMGESGWGGWNMRLEVLAVPHRLAYSETTCAAIVNNTASREGCEGGAFGAKFLNFSSTRSNH